MLGFPSAKQNGDATATWIKLVGLKNIAKVSHEKNIICSPSPRFNIIINGDQEILAVQIFRDDFETNAEKSGFAMASSSRLKNVLHSTPKETCSCFFNKNTESVVRNCLTTDTKLKLGVFFIGQLEDT